MPSTLSFRLFACLCLCVSALHSQENSTTTGGYIRQVNVIALPNVKGMVERIAYNPTGRQLIVAETSNNTVELVNTANGQVEQTIPGFKEPFGVAYARDLNRFAVANRKEGSVAVLAANTLELETTIKLDSPVDVMRYDPKPHILWIGRSKGTVALLDIETGNGVGDLKLEGPPASFVMETGGTMLYVGVPKVHHIVLVDRIRQSVVKHWQVPDDADFYAIALDEISGRLFLGCKNPSRIMVLNTKTGAQVASINTPSPADDLVYDPVLHCVIQVSGAGSLELIAQDTPDKYRVIDSMPTAKDARGACYITQARQLYLAIPGSPEKDAEIRVYALSARKLH